MAAVVSITSINSVGQQIRVAFNLALSGNYVTGGDTVNFATAVQDPAFVGMAAAIEALGAPISLDIWDQGGNLTDTVFPVLGTTISNSKVKFASAFNTELAAAAYPAAITGSKIAGEAIFNKL